MGEGGHLGVPCKKELAVVDIVVTARSGDGTSMLAFGASFSVEELHDVTSCIGKEILPLR
jgi:hypothetical protein